MRAPSHAQIVPAAHNTTDGSCADAQDSRVSCRIRFHATLQYVEPGADPMRVSACMIVKDEAPVLGSSLDSLRGRVDEIVVVDNGSTDGSVAIAGAAGARVLSDPGDLSAIRNRALAEARGDYCLMIDADEVVQPETWAAFAHFLREGRHPRGRIQVISETAEGIASVWNTRVCVNDGRFRYEGTVHEQLAGPGSVGNTGLAVLHSGYSPAALARKGSRDRNLRLLEAELASRPRDAYLNYQLGKTRLVSGRAAESLAAFAVAVEHASPQASFTSALACDYGYALKSVGRVADGLAVVRRFQPHYPDYTDLWFLEGLCHLALGDAGRCAAPSRIAWRWVRRRSTRRCRAWGPFARSTTWASTTS
jgi:glycosyltransferase involved in cell wall biosynthesis